MISDVLYEAVASMEDYLRRLPHCYAGLEPWIQQVMDDMDELRRYLDTPPSLSDGPLHDGHIRHSD